MSVRFNEPFMAGREMEYLAEVCRGRHFGGNGPFTRRAQALLQDRFGVPHVLLTHSATAALEMAALLLDTGPGDEVILPSYTFVSTASAFLRTGATLVFCEVDAATMNIDPADVERRITDRTRVIVPIHYAGWGADMAAIDAIAAPRGITVVEDAAQGVDARLDGRWLGTLSPLAAISFHETKNLHCGLGGALFVNDPAYFERAEDIWERGTNRTKQFRGLVDKYSWVELGSSFYPSELQAAFLLAQLEAMDRNTSERRALCERYDAGLRPLAARGLLALPRTTPGHTHNHHAVFVLFPSDQASDHVRRTLLADDIHAFIGYVPLHSSRMGQRLGWKAEDLPVTEEMAGRVLRLPLHNQMTMDDVDRVVAAVERAAANA